VLAASPANTAIARQAHSRFWVPSPAVAADPSLAPMRRFATPEERLEDSRTRGQD